MQSIETSFKGITRVFCVVVDRTQTIVLKKCTKIDVFSRIKDYYSTKHSCFCVLLVEFNECYRLRLVLVE